MQILHGIISLILIKIAILVALVYLFFTSAAAGMIYLVLVTMASLAILFAYCAKCEARDQYCSHLFPGKATRWLPARRQGPYSPTDMLVTAGSLAVVFIFPQYWLWQNKAALFFFWAPTIIAATEILWCVCRSCRNHNCVLCRKSG